MIELKKTIIIIMRKFYGSNDIRYLFNEDNDFSYEGI